jgi:hypothetical protein
VLPISRARVRAGFAAKPEAVARVASPAPALRELVDAEQHVERASIS